MRTLSGTPAIQPLHVHKQCEQQFRPVVASQTTSNFVCRDWMKSDAVLAETAPSPPLARQQYRSPCEPARTSTRCGLYMVSVWQLRLGGADSHMIHRLGVAECLILSRLQILQKVVHHLNAHALAVTRCRHQRLAYLGHAIADVLQLELVR